jgi:hypothetical protein
MAFSERKAGFDGGCEMQNLRLARDGIVVIAR